MHLKNYMSYAGGFMLAFVMQANLSNVCASDSTNSVYRILPVAYYTPETNIGFGAIFYTYFKTTQHDSLTHISNTQTYLNYTFNKQILFQTYYSVFTKGNAFYFKGDVDGLKFPEYYFGIGNNTHQEVKTLIDVKSIVIKSKFYALVKKQFYAGVLFHYQNLAMLKESLMSNNPEKDIYGDMGFSSTGLGLAVLKDARDNQLNPERGYYLEMTWATYYDNKKNQRGFNAFTFDLRGYKTFFNKLVLNSNFYTVVSTTGEIPFKMMPYIGGPRFLRGYYEGRFRDNCVLLGQVELRYPLFWRLGLAVFTGVGQVAHQVSDYDISALHYNYGAGLRFKVDRKQNANIRFDIGVTKDSYGFYVVFAEAF